MCSARSATNVDYSSISAAKTLLENIILSRHFDSKEEMTSCKQTEWYADVNELLPRKNVRNWNCFVLTCHTCNYGIRIQLVFGCFLWQKRIFFLKKRTQFLDHCLRPILYAVTCWVMRQRIASAVGTLPTSHDGTVWSYHDGRTARHWRHFHARSIQLGSHLQFRYLI